MKHNQKVILAALSSLLIVVARSIGASEAGNKLSDAFGPLFEGSRGPAARVHPKLPHGTNALDEVLYWNRVAIDASGLDHTPPAPGENRVFHEQLGPGRASRATAIVHIAIFDAINAISGGYKSYTGIAPLRAHASIEAAIAQAAHDTLVALYPAQAATMDELLADDLKQISVADKHAKPHGIALGRRAAAAILRLRSDDGSQHPEPMVNVDFVCSNDPGKWRQDPISLIPLALGAHWGEVRPFVLQSSDQFRVSPPPDMTSAEYTAAYDEVERLGGDGIVTPTERTADQTQTGIYWAYDGTPSLCAPPRLYNQIAVQLGMARGLNAVEMARLLALANTAMADAGIAIWESKYYYQLWRPITGIRESDPGTGPTGLGDGNSDTVCDTTFTPLGAPASNLEGPNFTPPFPAYPSGHAGFGGALFEALRTFFKTDDIPFTFVSDEFNGVTKGNDGNVRPLVPRSFTSLSQAEEENGQSRIYLGIHWRFDKTEGIAQGEKIADYVFTHAFQPLKHAPHQ